MDIIEYLAQLNIPTLLGMFAISWYFTYELRSDFRRQSDKFDAELDEIKSNAATQSERTDKLYQMFIDLLKDGKK